MKSREEVEHTAVWAAFVTPGQAVAVLSDECEAIGLCERAHPSLVEQIRTVVLDATVEETKRWRALVIDLDHPARGVS